MGLKQRQVLPAKLVTNVNEISLQRWVRSGLGLIPTQ